jgi:hypothetical protein
MRAGAADSHRRGQSALGEVLPGGSLRLQVIAARLSCGRDPSLMCRSARHARFPCDRDAALLRRSSKRATWLGGRHCRDRRGGGVLLGGSIRAASGNPAEVAGGSLEIALDPSRRNDSGPTTYSPRGDRDIRVVASAAPLVVGSVIPETLWGTAYLPASLLNASGADVLRLRAANTRSMIAGTPDVLTGRGGITFVDDVSLSARSRIELDAATLRSTGGDAQVAARAVSLGNQNTIDQATIDQPIAGGGTLGVTARLLELVGRLTTSGFSELGLTSEGELRLRGVAAPGETAPMGALRTTGSVTLRAREIAPTTLSDFTISAAAANGSAGRIVTAASPGDDATVLSAGGRVRFEADEILHGGVIRAPLGRIELAARGALTVEDGSLLTSSADGATIPFGFTQGGFDWAYELPNGRTLEYGPDARPLPAQSVLHDVTSIDFRPGATIDLRGGGELQAYEFVPGVTGTRDVLSPLVRPEQFALLPTAALEFAPYDAAESALFRPETGRMLTIPAGFADLPAGTYAMLPARYALLPGALLVTRDPLSRHRSGRDVRHARWRSRRRGPRRRRHATRERLEISRLRRASRIESANRGALRSDQHGRLFGGDDASLGRHGCRATPAR